MLNDFYNVLGDFHNVFWTFHIEKTARAMQLAPIALLKRFSGCKNFREPGNGGGSIVQAAGSLEQPSARSVGRLSQ
ncbi:MAG TPA: hypothetical protein VIA62_10420 [Thermoanaerobaculia bacterium]|nr:hypothetical protein [Thermoanaerobaculia bacterium]